MKRIALIHTVKSVYDTFEGRVRQAVGGELLIHNILDDFLASDPNVRGEFTADNLNRLFYDLKAAELTHPDLIAVTCSTLTPSVVKIRPFISVPVIAIDDAMTKLAVQLGAKITIMATAQSTVEPTRQKILSDAEKAGKTVEISTLVCPEAFKALGAGEKLRHDELLKKAALDIKNQEVVVLAQASMAHLEKDIQQICGCKVLSSPELCVEQIKQALEA